MNYLDLFIQNFKQDCTLHKIGYKERDKLEFDDYYKIGFQLDTFQLNYYDIHLLVDYEDELKAIHLLGTNVSKIADEIQREGIFYGVPVKIINLNDECLPGSITMSVKK